QLAIVGRVTHLDVEALAAQLGFDLHGRVGIRESEKEIHIVRLEGIRTALAQLVDEPRVPGIVLPLAQLLQVLPDAPRRDQSTEDRERVQPFDSQTHSSSAMVTLRPDNAAVISTWQDKRELSL